MRAKIVCEGEITDDAIKVVFENLKRRRWKIYPVSIQEDKKVVVINEQANVQATKHLDDMILRIAEKDQETARDGALFIIDWDNWNSEGLITRESDFLIFRIYDNRLLPLQRRSEEVVSELNEFAKQNKRAFGIKDHIQIMEVQSQETLYAGRVMGNWRDRGKAVIQDKKPEATVMLVGVFVSLLLIFLTFPKTPENKPSTNNGASVTQTPKGGNIGVKPELNVTAIRLEDVISEEHLIQTKVEELLNEEQGIRSQMEQLIKSERKKEERQYWLFDLLSKLTGSAVMTTLFTLAQVLVRFLELRKKMIDWTPTLEDFIRG